MTEKTLISSIIGMFIATICMVIWTFHTDPVKYTTSKDSAPYEIMDFKVKR